VRKTTNWSKRSSEESKTKKGKKESYINNREFLINDNRRERGLRGEKEDTERKGEVPEGVNQIYGWGSMKKKKGGLQSLLWQFYLNP